jgi:hypothetical protein
MTDFRKDVVLFREMLSRAIWRYASAARSGAAKPWHPPVTGVSFLFSMGDGTASPWVALSFDTQGNPGDDPSHPYQAFHEHFEWGAAMRYLLETEGARWPVILIDGQQTTCNSEEFEQRVGELFVHVLKTARQEGVFQQVPKAAKCALSVHQSGAPPFWWPDDSNEAWA